MKKFLATFLIFSSFIFVSSLEARSTLNGPTGLVTMPTAEALKYKEFNLSYDYLFAKKATNDSWSYKANLGTFKSWELGVVGGSKPKEGMFLNVKYYLMSDESRFPVMVAVGIQNISSNDLTNVYMVASKQFQGGLGAHFGFKATFADSIDPSIMVGLDYAINDAWGVMGDVGGIDKHYTLNLGTDFLLTPDVALRGSFIDVANSSIEGFRWGIGLAYGKSL
ncbi:MAG: hypothetical protein EXS67_02590 [Candidatus Margulisbacteria bacterium]|nr:hypothetical protein [Candidatus Margulisiibacteriota bacterium]